MTKHGVGQTTTIISNGNIMNNNNVKTMKKNWTINGQ